MANKLSSFMYYRFHAKHISNPSLPPQKGAARTALKSLQEKVLWINYVCLWLVLSFFGIHPIAGLPLPSNIDAVFPFDLTHHEINPWIMKLDIESIIVLRTVMKSLSLGVDPTSNIPFSNDTLLNSNQLKKCFEETADIFSFLEKNIDVINGLPKKRVTNQKVPFFIQDDELKTIPLSDDPITVSKFVYEINSICVRSTMRRLRATQITSWLTAQGYLEEVESSDGILCKSATKYGQALGITSVKKTNSRNEEYIVNFYNKPAQEFVLLKVIPNLM